MLVHAVGIIEARPCRHESRRGRCHGRVERRLDLVKTIHNDVLTIQVSNRQRETVPRAAARICERVVPDPGDWRPDSDTSIDRRFNNLGEHPAADVVAKFRQVLGAVSGRIPINLRVDDRPPVSKD
jgi:hypothetical protein